MLCLAEVKDCIAAQMSVAKIPVGAVMCRSSVVIRYRAGTRAA